MAYLAQKLGLNPPQMELVNLFVNNKRHGVYLAAEHWSKSFLETRGQAGTNNLYGENDFNFAFPGSVYYSPAQLKPFHSDELSLFENSADLDLFTSLLQIKDQEQFKTQAEQIIDIDNFLRWQAHSTLMFSRSQRKTHNLILNFNSQLGKLEFVPWNVTMTIKDVNSVPINVDYNPLMTRLLKNDTLYAQRNQILWDIVSDDKNLADALEFIDQTVKTARFDIFKDSLRRFTVAELFSSTNKFKRQITKAFTRLKTSLPQAQIAAYLTLHPKDINYSDNIAHLDIENRGFSPTQITQLELEHTATPSATSLVLDSDNDKTLTHKDTILGTFDNKNTLKVKDLIIATRSLWPNGQLQNQTTSIPDRRQRLFITSSQSLNIANLKIKTRNPVTDQKTKPLAVRLIDEATFRYLHLSNISKQEFLHTNPQFSADLTDKNKVILNPGTHFFNQITIIPNTVKLEIKPGARLLFSPNASLVSYAPVKAQATSSHPIIITSSSASPWGVFAVVGRHEQKSIFEHVKVSHGSENYINGIYFTGALAIHYADADIKNCSFQFNTGDDGLNIKNGKVSITDSDFSYNFFDGLDLDITQGKVKNNRFVQNGNDGFDISFSNLEINKNYIDSNGDKCISVGEKSTPNIFNNEIKNCVMGIAAKDLSQVNLAQNLFEQNQTAIAAYQKKPIFGGAQVIEANNKFINNNKDFDISDNSTLTHE